MVWLSLRASRSKLLKEKTVMVLRYEGEIHRAGEVDTQETHLTRGQTYHIDLDGLTNFDADPISPGVFDPTLTIYDQQGHQVAYNDDVSSTNRDSHIDFTPTVSGDYTFAVAGYHNETGDYTLTIA